MRQTFPTELNARINGDAPPCLLDVRQPEEHALAALPEAKLIPLGELYQRVAEIADWKERDVVVFCHHGIRSLQAVSLLEQLGFQQVENLVGGIDGWAREVDPSVPTY